MTQGRLAVVENKNHFQPSGAGDHERRDLTDLPFVAIDPPGAREVDDAIRVIRRPGGGFRLQAAIADGSQLSGETAVIDQAIQAGQTIYGSAESAKPMLPAAVVDELGLGQGVKRALIISQDYSAKAEVLAQPEIFSGLVKVLRTTYPRYGMHCRATANGHRQEALMEFGQAYRWNRGLSLRRPDNLRSLTDMKKFSSKLVQTCMAVSNMAVAEWAQQSGTPLIYRKFDVSDGLWTEQDDGGVVPLRAEYTSTPALHHGFQRFTSEQGVLYTHATSPLRRAADLVNHLLIANTLWGTSLPDSVANLDGVAHHINHVAA